MAGIIRVCREVDMVSRASDTGVTPRKGSGGGVVLSVTGRSDGMMIAEISMSRHEAGKLVNEMVDMLYPELDW